MDIIDSHKHNHRRIKYNRAFAIGIGLNIAYVILEIIYGFLANSSALLADAGHNASDVLALIFAWVAAYLASLKPKGKYTYGLRKSTVLVSILNALLLFGAVAAIAWDAFNKLKDPMPVAGMQVMLVAGVGVLVNTVTALLFVKGQKDDLNIKGAFLHMVADAAVSLGVVLAGLAIQLSGYLWIDPLMSFIIIAVILWGTWQLFVEAVNLALDAVPKHIRVEDVRTLLLAQDEVVEICDLHIWAMSTTEVALTARLKMSENCDETFLHALEKKLEQRFGIGHTTIQLMRKRDQV